MSEPFTFDDVNPDAQNEFDEIPAGTLASGPIKVQHHAAC
jgi:hypothetical protein